MSRLERPRAEATTVRIRLEAHEQLRELAENRGETMQDTLSGAIDRLWREDFWERTNAAYEALRSDPALWQQELEERSEWQGFDPWPDE
jgi:predicted DNA-binding protein